MPHNKSKVRKILGQRFGPGLRPQLDRAISLAPNDTLQASYRERFSEAKRTYPKITSLTWKTSLFLCSTQADSRAPTLWEQITPVLHKKGTPRNQPRQQHQWTYFFFFTQGQQGQHFSKKLFLFFVVTGLLLAGGKLPAGVPAGVTPP